MMAALPFSASGQVLGTLKTRVVLCCQPTNDLYDLLASRGGRWARYDSPQDAVRYAPSGGGVLILADGYPEDATEIKPELFDLAGAKGLRMYIEYPKSVLGLYSGLPRETQGERVVVTSNLFAPALPRLSILAMHNGSFIPVDAVGPDLALARVAGFDTAVYELPPWITPRSPDCRMFPVLVKNPLGQILVGTTKLSQFITGRYAPAEAWRTVWEKIFEWLAEGKFDMPVWTPAVGPSFDPQEPLPADAGLQAMRRGVQWYFNAKMLVDAAWQDKVKAAAAYPDRIGPGPERNWRAGNGTLGMLEGFSSKIGPDGRQPVRYWLRNDCMGEASFAIAFHGVIENDPMSRQTAGNLNDFIHATSDLRKGPRSDPKSPSFGLIGWDTDVNVGVYYGDDNARSMLGTLGAAAMLQTDRWDEGVLRCLLANLRTTGSLGFRFDRIEDGVLQKAGWQHYFNGPTVNFAPHYEAYLWACFLWAYRQTEYAPFLDRVKTALRMTMEAYPDKWRWTNGLQQERARMLLPLAWLVRIEDTPEHRQWLRRIADDLLARQDACGAIREELGTNNLGQFAPPKSNEEYGTNEAPIIQANGDPACDLLYTTNFAFLGLHEAAAATGEPAYAEAERKLAEFLCRIQIRSETHPELDGGWFRAFDFKRWEYWGSNSDAGWGAWSIETGWTQAWITSVFALRHMNTSFWDLTAGSAIKKHLAELTPLMLSGAFDVPEDEKVSHLAGGKPVAAAAPYAPPYSGGGDGALTNGRIGKPDPTHPAWQGYQGIDLDATVDLGGVVPVTHIESHFLQSTRVGIYLPSTVEYAVSQDGAAYSVAGAQANDVPVTSEGPLIKTFSAEIQETPARFVRIHAKNVGVIPEGLPDQGQKAWLFVDELIVR
jgi:hypothetical protein